MRGIVRNIAHSYSSIMHFGFMDEVFNIMMEKDVTTFTVDILNNKLLTDLPKRNVFDSEEYLDMLKRNVKQIGMDFKEISSVILKFDMDTKKTYYKDLPFGIGPAKFVDFICEVTIKLTNGMCFTGKIADSWLLYNFNRTD